MGTAISKLIADLTTLLASDGLAVPVLLGARHLSENAAPPRIVAVPTTDEFRPPMRVGTNPRELASALTGVQLHLWARTHDEAIDMRDAIVRACHRKAFASLVIRGGGFLRPDQDAWIKAGEVYALEVALPLPIYDTPTKATVKPTDVELDATGAASGDGKLTGGET